jgi:hypothetical protein
MRNTIAAIMSLLFTSVAQAQTNIAASRSTCPVIDRGPNTPASEPAAAARTKVSSRSRLSC